jgi:hypothetical protein
MVYHETGLALSIAASFFLMNWFSYLQVTYEGTGQQLPHYLGQRRE